MKLSDIGAVRALHSRMKAVRAMHNASNEVDCTYIASNPATLTIAGLGECCISLDYTQLADLLDLEVDYLKQALNELGVEVDD